MGKWKINRRDPMKDNPPPYVQPKLLLERNATKRYGFGGVGFIADHERDGGFVSSERLLAIEDAERTIESLRMEIRILHRGIDDRELFYRHLQFAFDQVTQQKHKLDEEKALLEEELDQMNESFKKAKAALLGIDTFFADSGAWVAELQIAKAVAKELRHAD